MEQSPNSRTLFILGTFLGAWLGSLGELWSNLLALVSTIVIVALWAVTYALVEDLSDLKDKASVFVKAVPFIGWLFFGLARTGTFTPTQLSVFAVLLAAPFLTKFIWFFAEHIMFRGSGQSASLDA